MIEDGFILKILFVLIVIGIIIRIEYVRMKRRQRIIMDFNKALTNFNKSLERFNKKIKRK